MDRRRSLKSLVVLAAAAVVALLPVSAGPVSAAQSSTGVEPLTYLRLEAVNAAGQGNGTAIDTRQPGSTLVLDEEFRYVSHSGFVAHAPTTLEFAYLGRDSAHWSFFYTVTTSGTVGPVAVDVLSGIGSSNTGGGILQTIGTIAQIPDPNNPGGTLSRFTGGFG